MLLMSIFSFPPLIWRVVCMQSRVVQQIFWISVLSISKIPNVYGSDFGYVRIVCGLYVKWDAIPEFFVFSHLEALFLAL